MRNGSVWWGISISGMAGSMPCAAAAAVQIVDRAEVLQMLRCFHDVGLLMHHDEEGLRDLVVCQPQLRPELGRLGRARREAKDLAGAAQAFEKCGDDARAKFWAACCRGDPSEDAPIEHLEALYDGYAGRYDAHLSDALRSQAPALVAESVRGAKARKALDCGCGTGLSGRALFDAEACSKLDGVDLSEAMCERARATGLYEDVAKGELCPYRGVLHSNEETPDDRNVRRAD